MHRILHFIILIILTLLSPIVIGQDLSVSYRPLHPIHQKEPLCLNASSIKGKIIDALTPTGQKLQFQVLSFDEHSLKVVRGEYNDESYRIPEYVVVDSVYYSVTEIDNSAFLACSQLHSIQFPSTLKKIGTFAFCNTFLEEIILPDGLEEIGKYAFKNVRHISHRFGYETTESLIGHVKEIYIPLSVKRIGKNAFHMIGDKQSPRSNYQGYLSCLPKIVTVENCGDYGIDDAAVLNYIIALTGERNQ